MRLIKVFIVGLIGLFIVMTMFSLIIPSHVKVSRMVVIKGRSKSSILSQIIDLRNWKNWQPMFKSDSVKINFTDTSSLQKSTCEIKYNDKTTILSITGIDTAGVRFVLKSEGENTIENQMVVTALPLQNSSQVEWRAVTHLKWYPWEKFYGIFIDKLTGQGYENSLNGLKEYEESVKE